MSPSLSCLYIYLTDHCNLRCRHCYRSASSSRGALTYLKFADCRRFLDDALKLGVRGVILSGGEPLLSPEFPAFARFLYDKRLHCTIETNGLLLFGVPLESIARYRCYCAISLDGITPDTHNHQRGSATAYQRTRDGIMRLEAQKLRYQLIMAISKSNYMELPSLLEWVSQTLRYCDLVKLNVVNGGGRSKLMEDQGLLFGPQDLVRIADEVGQLSKAYPFISLHVDPAFIALRHAGLKCYCGGSCGFHSALSVLADGSVSVCSLGQLFPAYVFGHVSNIDIATVVRTNQILRDIQHEPHKKLNGVCGRCIFKRSCLGGCRAMALMSYGDFFAPHPMCQAYFESGCFPRSRLV